VVKYAQTWVSHIEARPNAPEGTVEHFGTDWSIDTLKPQDLVVCRKTAPLVTLALKMIRGKRQVQILGNELGQGLKSLIKKMNAKNIDLLEEKLRAYEEREVKKAQDKDDDQLAEMIMDKVGAILFLISCLQETKRTIPELEIGIDYLFKDKTNAVTLCTIHKSKGLEADRVFWLNRSECPSKWARQEWQKQQELNLCYVAATRAKSYLATIELKEEE
jgi:superfamily I DNA/RNA helicase